MFQRPLLRPNAIRGFWQLSRNLSIIVTLKIPDLLQTFSVASRWEDRIAAAGEKDWSDGERRITAKAAEKKPENSVIQSIVCKNT
ncbi:hypothetical protein F2Q69_00063889 [Brassica cretica]|uniref:Uncharacterized protein n=1 Tax=Brassica cretica TaxID=69181 RepID=A0A8S9RAF8_BRACR|nr:hypothetical protein F2Q69_00063889 [Brassica cretica]